MNLLSPLFAEKAEKILLFRVTKDEGHTGESAQRRGIDLCVATGDHHPAVWIETAGAADEIAGLTIGSGGDGAGIDNHQFSAGVKGDDRPAGRCELLFEGGRFELVGFATEGGKSGGTEKIHL